MRIAKVLMGIALLGVLFTYPGCSPKPPEPVNPQDAQLAKLTKTWKCTAATLGSTAQSGYSNFTLKISGAAGDVKFPFNADGRPPGTNSSPWPAIGNFTFGSDFATILTRDDSGAALPITYSVSDTQLQMSFNYAGTGFNGRVDNVNGNWVFTFTAP